MSKAIISILLLLSAYVHARAAIAAGEILDLVSRHVYTLYGEQPVTLTVEGISIPELWRSGDGDSVAVRYSRQQLPRGVSIFHLDAFRGRMQVRRLSVTVNVRVVKPVYVLIREIEAGQPVPVDALLRTEREITDENGEPVSAVPDEGAITRRRLSSGDILMADDLKPRPVITRGEQLYLIHHQDGITVKVLATALQNGQMADIIYLSTDHSRKRLRGRIRGPGDVELVR